MVNRAIGAFRPISSPNVFHNRPPIRNLSMPTGARGPLHTRPRESRPHRLRCLREDKIAATTAEAIMLTMRHTRLRQLVSLMNALSSS